MKSRFLLSTLALLGFSGCSEGTGIFGDVFTEPDMYGVPLVDYRFMGELVDADGNPIKGIEVKVSSTDDVVESDDKGAFNSEFTTYAEGGHIIAFTDVDGVENGGEFATKSVEVDWSDSEQKDGRDVFNLGTVTLDAKEQ